MQRSWQRWQSDLCCYSAPPVFFDLSCPEMLVQGPPLKDPVYQEGPQKNLCSNGYQDYEIPPFKNTNIKTADPNSENTGAPDQYMQPCEVTCRAPVKSERTTTSPHANPVVLHRNHCPGWATRHPPANRALDTVKP